MAIGNMLTSPDIEGTWPASSATRCATDGCCAAGSPSRAAAGGRVEIHALSLA
jgi:hypothetical protein